MATALSLLYATPVQRPHEAGQQRDRNRRTERSGASAAWPSRRRVGV